MQRHQDLARQRTPLKTEWTSRVVLGTQGVEVDETTGEKTPVFQTLLNDAFAELRDGGYHVTQVQPLQGGFVIFANRVVPGELEAARELGGDSEVTATYHWLERGREQSKSFPSLEEAVRVASSHFKDPNKRPVSVCVASYCVLTAHELARVAFSFTK